MSGPQAGDRVRLIRHNDEFSKLKPGTLGTVTFVDDMGTVHIRWDDGSALGMIAEAGDQIQIIGQSTYEVVQRGGITSEYIGPDLPGDREAEYLEPRHTLADELAEAITKAQRAGVTDDEIEADFAAVMSILSERGPEQ